MKTLKLLAVLMVLTGLFACSPGDVETQVSKTTLISTGINADEWAVIPAGEFYKGQHAHPTLINYDFEIMITDVTNEQYVKYLNDALTQKTIKIDSNEVMGYYPGDEFHGYQHEFEIKEGYWLHMPLDEPGMFIQFDGQQFTVISGFENHPATMITWFGAKAYCDFYGWRLPSENEWEKAARGTDKRIYPWGDEVERTQANFYSSHNLIQKIFGKQSVTTPVGYFNGKTYSEYTTKQGISPYGLYDMAGNVWQWTSDDYPDVHYRYMRGGSFTNYEYNIRVWARNNAGPDYYSFATGFRCARDIQKNDQSLNADEETIHSDPL